MSRTQLRGLSFGLFAWTVSCFDDCQGVFGARKNVTFEIIDPDGAAAVRHRLSVEHLVEEVMAEGDVAGNIPVRQPACLELLIPLPHHAGLHRGSHNARNCSWTSHEASRDKGTCTCLSWSCVMKQRRGPEICPDICPARTHTLCALRAPTFITHTHLPFFAMPTTPWSKKPCKTSCIRYILRYAHRTELQ